MFDVIIVGGGPAGLSAGLMLGRSRRRVVICDAGQPRNAVSHAVHGFFSWEGVDPSELQRTAKEQLRPFATEFCDLAAVNAFQHTDTLEIELKDGKILPARRLLLATGAVDILPDIEGFREFWGASVFHCPYCHGWEVRDQPLAVYGKGSAAVEQALLLTAWTSDLIICSDGPASLSLEEELKLSAARIAIREQKICRLKGSDGLLDVIEFEDGSLLPRRGIFLRPRLQYSNALARELGCTLAETGAIRIDETYQTTVAGVYAAGECAGTCGQVIVMAAEGARAAYAINRDLVQEDLQQGTLPSQAAPIGKTTEA